MCICWHVYIYVLCFSYGRGSVYSVDRLNSKLHSVESRFVVPSLVLPAVPCQQRITERGSRENPRWPFRAPGTAITAGLESHSRPLGYTSTFLVGSITGLLHSEISLGLVVYILILRCVPPLRVTPGNERARGSLSHPKPETDGNE